MRSVVTLKDVGRGVNASVVVGQNVDMCLRPQSPSAKI